MQGLAEELSGQFEHLSAVSREAIRRLFVRHRIVYRRAKAWLKSPDPLYLLHKRQRDRLLVLARAAPDGAAVWLDESWFIRWPYSYWAWAPQGKAPRVAKRWSEPVDTTALYVALDDESQEAFCRWAVGQPDSAETIRFLKRLMAHWNRQNKRFIVLFWDHLSALWES